MPLAFGLYTSLRGVVAEVLVNGVPLSACAAGMSADDGVPATEWLVEGANELRLVIEAAPSALATDGEGPADASPAEPLVARAEILRGQLGEVPEAEGRDVVARVSFAPPVEGPLVWPFVATATFQLQGRPRWAWQDASPVAPEEPAVRAELLAFVRGIHADLAARDVDAILGKAAPRFADAPGLGVASEDAKARFRRSFLAMVATEGYSIAPMEEGEVVFRAVAEGRVVRVTSRVDDASPLRSGLDASAEWLFDVWIARIEGQLAIVR